MPNSAALIAIPAKSRTRFADGYGYIHGAPLYGDRHDIEYDNWLWGMHGGSYLSKASGLTIDPGSPGAESEHALRLQLCLPASGAGIRSIYALIELTLNQPASTLYRWFEGAELAITPSTTPFENLPPDGSETRRRCQSMN